MSVHILTKIFGLSAALVLFAVSPAEAATQKMGDVINQVGESFENFPSILAVFAYLGGLFFAITGVFKFKDHVDNPGQNPLSAGVKRFLAGGMLLTGPYVGSALMGSLFASPGSNQIDNTARNAVPSGGGMDALVVNLVSNVAGPLEALLIAFSYIAAIILLLVGVTRLTKTAQEGPRGPAGLGTIMTLFASGALFSFGDMMGAFSASLFGTTTITTFAQIDPAVISNAADADRIEAVIEAVLAFIMIVGYIAFLRGFFVLKSFADGNSQVSLAQALTFLFGGAMAINLGPLVNVLQETVGVSGLTFS